MSEPLTPSLLLSAYAAGFFPMADNRDSAELFWLDPEERGVFPLSSFHVPKRLKRRLLSPTITVRVDSCFDDVMRACASPAAGRTDTWINAEILALYGELHQLGHAHSIEVFEADCLIGGLYGIRLGGAFFGESMFSLGDSGSKLALVHTAARLKKSGFQLFDCQFWTSHLAQFGCAEIARADYQVLLRQALATYPPLDPALSASELEVFVQVSTQTS